MLHACLLTMERSRSCIDGTSLLPGRVYRRPLRYMLRASSSGHRGLPAPLNGRMAERLVDSDIAELWLLEASRRLLSLAQRALRGCFSGSVLMGKRRASSCVSHVDFQPHSSSCLASLLIANASLAGTSTCPAQPTKFRCTCWAEPEKPLNFTLMQAHRHSCIHSNEWKGGFERSEISYCQPKVKTRPNTTSLPGW